MCKHKNVDKTNAANVAVSTTERACQVQDANTSQGKHFCPRGDAHNTTERNPWQRARHAWHGKSMLILQAHGRTVVPHHFSTKADSI
eukprot:893851-Amphidinium_carterae.1